MTVDTLSDGALMAVACADVPLLDGVPAGVVLMAVTVTSGVSGDEAYEDASGNDVSDDEVKNEEAC